MKSIVLSGRRFLVLVAFAMTFQTVPACAQPLANVDDPALSRLLEQLEDLWRDGSNPAGIATLWHPIGDVARVGGQPRWAHGRDAIEHAWAKAWQHRTGKEYQMEINLVHLVGSDLAVVDGNFIVLGQTETPEGENIREPFTCVVRREGEGEWLIIAMRASPVVPIEEPGQ